MMNVRIDHVELSEAGNLVPHEWLAEQAEHALVMDVVLESQLGARKQTDRYTRFPNGCKAAGQRPLEDSRDKLVSNLGGPRSDEVQTVIAH